MLWLLLGCLALKQGPGFGMYYVGLWASAASWGSRGPGLLKGTKVSARLEVKMYSTAKVTGWLKVD